MNKFSSVFPKELPINAKLTDFSFGNKEKTISQKNGIGYEKRLHEKLLTLSKEKEWLLLHNPGFSYQDISGRTKLCAPDFILIQKQKCLILEAKLRHTADAFYQLTHLYLPVIQCWHSFEVVKCIEVCKKLDPSGVHWPEEYYELDNLEEIFSPLYHSMPFKTGVVEWRK